MARVYKNMPVQPYGTYAHQVSLAFVDPDPEFGFTGRPLLGVPAANHYMYGSFRSLESDAYYCFLKQFSPNFVGRNAFMRVNGQGDFEVMPETMMTYRGNLLRGSRDRQWGVWCQQLPGMPYFEFFTDSDSCRWEESGLLEMEGESLGSIMQMCIPDDVSPMVYTTHNYRISDGTMCGERVSGFFCHDYINMPLMQHWLEGEYFNHLEGLWVVFLTEYEDGGWDKGNLSYGRENFNCAIIERSNGDNVVATDVEFEWTLGDDQYAQYCRIKIDEDQIWEFKPRFDGGGPRLPIPPIEGRQGPPNWVEGVVTRVGENRQWTDSEAYFETYAPALRAVGRQ